MPQTLSTRWCPTPDQLMILEEMYRTGVRTPNASQIQQITAHLSLFGKIEGKNVFYWFQNHKARDRQKLRRRLSRQHQLLHGYNNASQPPLPPPLQFHNLQEAGGAPLSPASQLCHHSPPLHFLHQGSVQEATQGMNLLCKLETGEGSTSSTSHGDCCCDQWMMMMESGSSSGVHVPPPLCCRPLRTLELFPTTSTGFKDECSTSKSSSCSTSTN